MSIQTIKTIDGQEFVLLPLGCYEKFKMQIDRYLAQSTADTNDNADSEYVPFVLEEYVQNPVALARINCGVTQKELAKRMKVSQAYVSKLESNQHVSAKVMLKVNKALKNA